VPGSASALSLAWSLGSSCHGSGNAMRPDDHRRTVVSYVSNAGIGLMAIGIVLPLVRPHLLIAWAIAIGLAAGGTVCIGVSQWLVKNTG
jgi:hypothetical protein